MKFSTFARLLAWFGAAFVAMPVAAAQESGVVVFNMPEDGHATIAIDSPDGKRVRNLFGNLPLKAGEHRFEWDGRNDAGDLMPAGSYRWVGLRRKDIAAVYRGTFQHGNPPWLHGKTGAWVGDHSPATAVVALGDRMILGSNEAEWGHGLIACDIEGVKQWGVKWLDRRAWCGGESLAVSRGRVFVSSYLQETAVWEVNPLSGTNAIVFERKDLPAELSQGERKPALRVAGGHATGHVGELYVCDVTSPEPLTIVLRLGKTGERLTYHRSMPIRIWSMAWLSDGRCIAATDRAVVELDSQTGQTKPFTDSSISAPWGIAIDSKDRVFVSDQGATGQQQYSREGQLSHRYLRLDTPASHQVKIFDHTGKLLHAIGRDGGQPVGAIDPESFMQPAGLAVDYKGRLWVTEFTQSPKRVSVWTIPEDLASAKPSIAHQFIGPAHYGGGAAMIDPGKPWEIMDTNFGVVFNVDIEKGDYRAASLPWRHVDFWKEHGRRDSLPFAGRPGLVIPIDGRRFTATQGGYMHGDDARWQPHVFSSNGPTMIGEYVDGVFVPRAAVGSMRMWMRNRELKTRREEQWVPKPILDAAKERPDWPALAKEMGMGVDDTDVPHVEHQRGSADWIVHPWPKSIGGFLWVDANGDSKVDPSEVTFHPMGDHGPVTIDADLNIYWQVDAWHEDEFVGTWKLTRDGFNSTGAPNYKWSNLKKLSDAAIAPSHVGADGSLLGRNWLRDAEGKLVWSYPSDNRGVKALGKDSRAVLKPGSLHRVAALQGVARGPGSLGDVFVLQSTDGMKYLMTRDDGLFITMLFRPYSFADGWDSIPADQAKDGLRLDEYSLQDECFNAHFVRAEADGQGFRKGAYYLLGMSRSAVVEVTGLEGVERFPGGTIELKEGEGLFGRGERSDPAAQSAPPPTRRTVGPLVATQPRAGEDMFRGRRVEFGGADVQVAWRKDGLHFKWHVKADSTPFVNQGADWTQAFATGDGLEFQVKSPSLGRLRFIAAMHQGDPTLVRIRYDGEPNDTAVTYRSDVGTTPAAAVERIGQTFGVRKLAKTGYVVQFMIPWREMDIDAPSKGMELPIELGVMYSDTTGNKTQAREFWVSGTGMVADLPTEAKPSEKWGKLILGE